MPSPAPSDIPGQIPGQPRAAIIARRVLSACFLAAGLGIGVWGANIPALTRRTGMTEGQVGFVLLCFAAGALLAMSKAPRLIARIGAERASILATVLFGMSMACVGIATQMLVATLIAIMCGLSFGVLEVAMNKHAADLEARAGRPIMSSLHAMFSAGALCAAAIYAGLAYLDTPSPASLAIMGALIVAIALICLRHAAPHVATRTAPVQKAARTAQGRGQLLPVLVLGTTAFVIFFAEGALMDWTAIYLVRVLGTTEGTGALGYAAFTGMMAIGRLIGDEANRALGPVLLFRLGLAGFAIGLGVALSASSVAVVFIALGFCGLGAANIAPLVFSAAGQLSLNDGGRAMSRVLSMGYAGILIGPALIGFVAEAASLRLGLAIVAGAVAGVLLCSRMIRL
jgi:MFS family permease